MSRLSPGKHTFLHSSFARYEVLVSQFYSVRKDRQDNSERSTTAAILAFSLLAFLFPYALIRLPGPLSLNPQGFGVSQVSPDQAFQHRRQLHDEHELAMVQRASRR